MAIGHEHPLNKTPNPLAGFYYCSEQLREFGFKYVGKNVRIHSRASIYCPENIELGDNIRIDDYTVVVATGPLRVGSYVNITNFCYLGSREGIYLDDFVTLAPGVRIFSVSDDYLGHKLTNITVPPAYAGGDQGKVRLSKHVIVGTQSVILPGLNIGEGVSVGACSLVKSSLKPWGVYAGIPARRIKERVKDLLKYEKLIKQRNDRVKRISDE